MDMVSLNIVGGILVSICRDMGVTLMRTSYSTMPSSPRISTRTPKSSR